jgi:hypothetical protein
MLRTWCQPLDREAFAALDAALNDPQLRYD